MRKALYPSVHSILQQDSLYGCLFALPFFFLQLLFTPLPTDSIFFLFTPLNLEGRLWLACH